MPRDRLSYADLAQLREIGCVRQDNEPEDNSEYVRAILRRAYADIALLGGTRRTPWYQNKYAEVLHGIDGLIDEHVSEED